MMLLVKTAAMNPEAIAAVRREVLKESFFFEKSSCALEHRDTVMTAGQWRSQIDCSATFVLTFPTGQQAVTLIG